MTIYADTSFLLSLYRQDANSAAALRTAALQEGDLLVTILAEIEVINGLELNVFRGELSAGEARRCRDNFFDDLRGGFLHLRALPESLIERARLLSVQKTATLGTRSMDLLHVAAALELGAESLYSFDDRQRKLARNVRLKLNPF